MDRPVVELAKTLTLLPAYLDAKVGSITLKNVRTQLGTCQSSLKVKRTLAKAQSNSRVMFRKITSIEIKRPALISTMSGRAYVAPRYQIPITGYWRKFTDDLRVGHDESGNEVQGRTGCERISATRISQRHGSAQNRLCEGVARKSQGATCEVPKRPHRIPFNACANS